MGSAWVMPVSTLGSLPASGSESDVEESEGSTLEEIWMLWMGGGVGEREGIGERGDAGDALFLLSYSSGNANVTDLVAGVQGGSFVMATVWGEDACRGENFGRGRLVEYAVN